MYKSIKIGIGVFIFGFLLAGLLAVAFSSGIAENSYLSTPEYF